jgi:hypothetical protein
LYGTTWTTVPSLPPTTRKPRTSTAGSSRSSLRAASWCVPRSQGFACRR